MGCLSWEVFSVRYCPFNRLDMTFAVDWAFKNQLSIDLSLIVLGGNAELLCRVVSFQKQSQREVKLTKNTHFENLVPHENT